MLMPFIRYITAVAFACVLSFCFHVSPAYADTVEIKLGTDAGLLAFQPQNVTIHPGDSVIFGNNKIPPHNVIFKDHAELSHPDLAFNTGDSWEETFETAGTYDFYCEPHAGAGMVAKVIVE